MSFFKAVNMLKTIIKLTFPKKTQLTLSLIIIF